MSASAPQSEGERSKVQRSVRTAPARPTLSSSPGSENEDDDPPSDAQDSDGVVPSETELAQPTVEQLLAEVSKSHSQTKHRLTLH